MLGEAGYALDVVTEIEGVVFKALLNDSTYCGRIGIKAKADAPWSF